MISSSQSIKFVKAIAVLTMVAIALTGCSVFDDQYRAGDAKELPTIQYVKEPSKGLCFAYAKARTYYGYTVYSIATVDCKTVGL